MLKILKLLQGMPISFQINETTQKLRKRIIGHKRQKIARNTTCTRKNDSCKIQRKFFEFRDFKVYKTTVLYVDRLHYLKKLYQPAKMEKHRKR